MPRSTMEQPSGDEKPYLSHTGLHRQHEPANRGDHLGPCSSEHNGGTPPATSGTPAGGETGDWNPDEGRIFYHGYKATVRGRTLQFILWLASNQARINSPHCDRGQLWLTWKGNENATITGKLNIEL